MLRLEGRRKIFSTLTDRARQQAASKRKELGLSPYDNIFVRDPRKLVKTQRGEEKGVYYIIDNIGDKWELSKMDSPGYSVHRQWIFRLSEDKEGDVSGRRGEMSIHDTFKSKRDATRALNRYLKNRAYSTEYGWIELGPNRKGINVLTLK